MGEEPATFAAAGTGAALDPGRGRLYMEAHDGSSWSLLSRGEQLDALARALEPKGEREVRGRVRSLLAALPYVTTCVVRKTQTRPDQTINSLHAFFHST